MKKIYEVSFGFNKEDFLKIELTSSKKEHKEVDYEFVRETFEMHGTYYRIKVKLEMHYLFIWCMC